MTLSNIIFSNKKSYRFVRHFAFWIIYCLYFYLQSLSPGKSEDFFKSDVYYSAFLNLCCFGPVFIFGVYFFTHYLLPQTIRKKRYFLFILGFLFVYALGTFINYFMAGIFLNNGFRGIEPNFQHKMEFGNFNTRWAMIIAIVALGTKVAKDWYLQQRENLEILKFKSRAEMQLQKSRFHPQLLSRSLNTIYNNIQSGSGMAPTLILNLSDLLSYSLYESDSNLIPLERELRELQNLISLEKQNKESLIEIQVAISGDARGALILPMVIVKTFEESIAIFQNNISPVHQLNSEIIISKDLLFLNLAFPGLQKHDSIGEKCQLLVANTRNRLSEFYTESDYEIKFIPGEDEGTIHLMIKLEANPEPNTILKPKLISSHYEPS
jgi:two-component system, LytTR family, sensor kinase